MADLITLTGKVRDTQGAVARPGDTVTAAPRPRVFRDSDGALTHTGATATVDGDGEISLPLTHAPGVRYDLTLRPGRHHIGTLDCDSHAPGSTVDVDDLPPVEGVPASREDILRAWITAQLGTGGSGVTISDDYILTIGA